MKYTKIEIDLNKCSLSTIIQIWIYSKPHNRSKEIKDLCTYMSILEVCKKELKNE